MTRRSPRDQESPLGIPGTVLPPALTRHTQKNGFPFPSEVILGGFLLISRGCSEAPSELAALCILLLSPLVASIGNDTEVIALGHFSGSGLVP